MAKNKEIETDVENLLDDAGEARVYELGFHLDAELPTEGVKKAYQAVRGVIEAAGEIVAEGEPQMIQLAYMISRQETAGRRDFSSAYFCWIAYETTAANHADVLASVGQDKNIVRFIDLVTTKEAARHAVELREFAAAERATDGENSSDDADGGAEQELDAALEKVEA